MFNNDRLDAVLARLSQIYPVDFVIQDSSLAETRYHATFSGESIHDILHLLEIGVPMQCVPTQRIDSSQRMIVYVYPPQKP
ncbi:MAG: FecR domain-containing protein [Alistipes communis]